LLLLKQIYVEIERARLTKMLAKIKEDEGDIDGAADILQEVAVVSLCVCRGRQAGRDTGRQEAAPPLALLMRCGCASFCGQETFGAMAKSEKIAYILEQVRLCLDRKDYTRALILSKKISPRVFREQARKEEAGEIGIEGTAIEAPAEGTPDMQALKLQYYGLLIRYYAHHDNYLEVCRSYKSILETKAVEDDSARWMPVLKCIVWNVVLAPNGTEQVTLLNNTAGDKRLEDMPAYKKLLSTFITDEVVRWSALSAEYASEMAAVEEVFGGESGEKRGEDFRLRVVEHNILVIAKYYSRVQMARLAELLDLSPEEVRSSPAPAHVHP
jgi:26S proteasome regulatory subunit N5